MRNGKPLDSLPNALTASRIAASLLLCFFQAASAVFISLYFFCGFTDMADGFLARKRHCVTRFGAMFDSIADLVFTFCLTVKLFPLTVFPVWLISWCCMIAVARVAALAICLLRFRQFGILHTYTNKAAGFVLFALLLPFCLLSRQWCAVVGCAVASVAAMDELIRMSLSKENPIQK